MKLLNSLFLAFLLITSIRAASQPVSTTEYTYDENGNMKGDANKHIAFIHYNVLNLPDTITYISGHKVLYTYSATGQKLRETLLSPQGMPVQRKDYLRNLLFQKKVDLNVDGKKTEMGREDVEHLLFGSPGVRLKGGDAVIINQGTSAERLNEQLTKLWMDMLKQLLPYGHLLL